jgi:hypothetical protein
MGVTYRTDEAVEAHATAIESGDGRHFLVVRFRIREWKTLVFQHAMAPDSWLSRRELHQNMEPIPALTGILFGAPQLPHPIESLKRQVEALRRDNWKLRSELLSIKKPHGRAVGERGKRGRRNP